MCTNVLCVCGACPEGADIGINRLYSRSCRSNERIFTEIFWRGMRHYKKYVKNKVNVIQVGAQLVLDGNMCATQGFGALKMPVQCVFNASVIYCWLERDYESVVHKTTLITNCSSIQSNGYDHLTTNNSKFVFIIGKFFYLCLPISIYKQNYYFLYFFKLK